MSLVKYGGKTKQEQIQYTPSNFGRPVLSAYSIEQGAKAYDARVARERAEKECKARQEQQEQQKMQALLDALTEAQNQNDDDIFTVNDLYEAGVEAKKNGDGLEAAIRFWQALVCGNGRGAYDLCMMFRTGNEGIPQNHEMELIMFSFARTYKMAVDRSDTRSDHLVGTIYLSNEQNNFFGKMRSLYSKAKDTIGNKPINQSILDTQTELFNDEIEIYSEALPSVFPSLRHHTVLELMELEVHEEAPDEVNLAGDDSASHGLKCVIM